jgi:hypothetical protein
MDRQRVDPIEQKRMFDAQLLKVTAEAAEFKAQFDKVGI